MCEERIYRSQNGRETKIEDMNTRHMENALAKLKREGFISQKAKNSYLSKDKPVGDPVAEAAFEEEYNRILRCPSNPYIDWFEEELERRNNLAVSRETEDEVETLKI